MIGLISFPKTSIYCMEQPVAVKCSIWIGAPRERVWNVITDAAEMEQCLHEYRSFEALQVGAALRFGPEADAVYAIIARLDAPCELLLHHPPQPQYYPVSIYTRYILADNSGGTCLTVIETGYEALPDDIRGQRIDSANEAHSWALAKLKNYLEPADA